MFALAKDDWVAEECLACLKAGEEGVDADSELTRSRGPTTGLEVTRVGIRLAAPNLKVLQMNVRIGQMKTISLPGQCLMAGVGR